VIFNAAFGRLLNASTKEVSDDHDSRLVDAQVSANWQRANIQAAASYLRERMLGGATDAKTKAVYDGLLEVLDPTRRATRLQREGASAAQGAATVKPARERRAHSERRATPIDRRRKSVGTPDGERRSGKERRAGRDRRS
jgi:hypothetical protein